MMQAACIYDITASWADNLQQGPQWSGPIPDRQLPPRDQWVDFLGFKVGFCVSFQGISPSILKLCCTTAVAVAAAAGADRAIISTLACYNPEFSRTEAWLITLCTPYALLDNSMAHTV